ncbi:MAG: M23 family metallopeptidase [Oscillospiraceae bacterium]
MTMRSDSRGRGRRPASKSAAGNSSFLFVTLMQGVLCAVMVAVAFVLSTVMGMTQLKPTFSALLLGETQAVEVLSALVQVAHEREPERLRKWMDSLPLRWFAQSELFVSSSPPTADPNGMVEAWGRIEAPGGQGGQLSMDSNAHSFPDSILPERVVLSAPLMLPVTGPLTSPFGLRQHPMTGEMDFHTGIDLSAPRATPIGAALPGIVVETGESNVYGNYVRLDHGGVETRYCHCDKVTVRVGMRLRQGECVALVGSTGMSTGPHVHFELLVNHRVADPLHVAGTWREP